MKKQDWFKKDKVNLFKDKPKMLKKPKAKVPRVSPSKFIFGR